METQKIIFKDEKSSETVKTFENQEEINSFLETFKLENGEVIELGDAMYTVKSVARNESETSVDVEFMDLIENKPTA